MIVIAGSWQKVEIVGPTNALIINNLKVVVVVVERTKRPILNMGHIVVERELERVKWDQQTT